MTEDVDVEEEASDGDVEKSSLASFGRIRVRFGIGPRGQLAGLVMLCFSQILCGVSNTHPSRSGSPVG